MNWNLVGYAAACVITPVVWGLVVVAASSWVDRAVQRRRAGGTAQAEETPLPPIEYHI